jgi:hypothetical protein
VTFVLAYIQYSIELARTEHRHRAGTSQTQTLNTGTGAGTCTGAGTGTGSATASKQGLVTTVVYDADDQQRAVGYNIKYMKIEKQQKTYDNTTTSKCWVWY